jgi:hypothetical protein
MALTKIYPATSKFSWPPHWLRVIEKIEQVELTYDHLRIYYVLPVDEQEFIKFYTLEEIDNWVRTVDRLNRS